MKLEYNNGRRITKHRHEMTLLEYAIQRYEEMAEKHYALKKHTAKTQLS